MSRDARSVRRRQLRIGKLEAIQGTIAQAVIREMYPQEQFFAVRRYRTRTRAVRSGVPLYLAFLAGPRIRPPSARPWPGAERTAALIKLLRAVGPSGSGVRCSRLQSIRAFPEGF